ncbi:hypothetical protein ACKFKF_34300 [Phormidesmis sp. 146-12]
MNHHLARARQTPYTIAEPLNRSHLILMLQHASLTDIATLKNDAYRAERNLDWDLAQQLWIRILAAASGQDMEAIEALQNLGIQRHTRTSPPQPEPPRTAESSKTASKSRSLTRRQVLQWAIPAGVGVVGVSVVSQLINVDYSELEGFLKAGKWKEADQETTNLGVAEQRDESSEYGY